MNVGRNVCVDNTVITTKDAMVSTERDEQHLETFSGLGLVCGSTLVNTVQELGPSYITVVVAASSVSEAEIQFKVTRKYLFMSVKQIVIEINAILEITEVLCRSNNILHFFVLPLCCKEISSGNSILVHLDFFSLTI